MARSSLESRLADAHGTGFVVGPEVTLDEVAGGGRWAEKRVVRAEFMQRLLDAELDAKRPRGLKLRGARIVGQLDLEDWEVASQITLLGCYVDEPLNLSDARLPVLRLPACHVPGIAGDGVETRGDLRLDAGFVADGEVRLIGAHVGGQFALGGARLCTPEGRALCADQIKVDQGVFCRGLEAHGEVRLNGARIGGQLVLSGANLSSEDASGLALCAPGLVVEEGMYCDVLDGHRFTAEGQVRLIGASIGGDFSLDGAQLVGGNGASLAADGLEVGRDMSCSGGFTADGTVRLIGARVGGIFNLDGARLTGRKYPTLVLGEPGGGAQASVEEVVHGSGPALAGDRLTVARSLHCGDGFVADGAVELVAARIGGQLVFKGAELSGVEEGVSLTLERAATEALDLTFAEPPSGAVVLMNARTGRLTDDPRTWPVQRDLRGFAYDSIESATDVRQRLRWIDADGHYDPATFTQLAAFYRREGREEDAGRVAIKKEQRRRAGLALPARSWSHLLYWTVGYGYRTWWATGWLVLVFAIGWIVFDQAQMRETKPSADLPAFQPAIYALDALLPIIDLGQQGGRTPTGFAQWWLWISIIAGWVLTTAIVAALSGLLRRSERQ